MREEGSGVRYTVREALSTDLAELARLRWDFRAEEQPRQSRDDFIAACERWLREALDGGRWRIAVAESGVGHLVGCMFLESVEKVPVPGGIHRAWGYITNSYVAEEIRGFGVGRELLDLLIDVGKDLAFEFMIVWPSQEAVKFYERAGFQPVVDAHAGPGDEPPLELLL